MATTASLWGSSGRGRPEISRAPSQTLLDRRGRRRRENPARRSARGASCWMVARGFAFLRSRSPGRRRSARRRRGRPPRPVVLGGFAANLAWVGRSREHSVTGLARCLQSTLSSAAHRPRAENQAWRTELTKGSAPHPFCWAISTPLRTPHCLSPSAPPTQQPTQGRTVGPASSSPTRPDPAG